jgi:hypothetical protein
MVLLRMEHQQTHPQALARRMLDTIGTAVIWGLHIEAAARYRTGDIAAAALLLDIADAAEKDWRYRMEAHDIV